MLKIILIWTGNESNPHSCIAFCKLDLDYNYSELSDIVQLDGPADSSDVEEELEEVERVPLEENDFLGIINAEAIKALQEGEESSDGNSLSSSSDSEGADELANVEEEVQESLYFCHWYIYGCNICLLDFEGIIFQDLEF